jgi:hypothetical protein
MNPPADGKFERAAIYAHLAARLNGIPTRDHTDWFQEVTKLEIKQQQVERVVSPIRWSSPSKGSRGRPGKKQRKLPWIIREWIDVREDRLGLIQVLVIVKGRGASPGDLVRQISDLPGITRVIETSTTRDLIADALFTDALQESRLRSRIEELTDREIHWEHVRTANRDPSLATWIDLAISQGATEGVSLSR